MTEHKPLDPGAYIGHEPELESETTPDEPNGHDMADVIEGPVGSASIVQPDDIPDREPTMPESGLADAVTSEPTPDA
jgi:hypothetical protein